MELQVSNGNLIYTDLKQVSILLNSITSIDVRARHDNGGSVDFTAVNGKLGVYKIGEY